MFSPLIQSALSLNKNNTRFDVSSVFPNLLLGFFKAVALISSSV